MIDELKATHEGKLPLNDVVLDVAVLSDGRRVITQSGVFRALGRPARGNARVIGIPVFMDAKNLQPYISEELRSMINKIDYIALSGGRQSGYDASILPLVCELYLQARDEGVIKASNQMETVRKAEALLRSFARLGITALVDEVTGYQYVRERDALHELLKAFIAEELQPWQKTFPDIFYQHIFRLNRWDYTVNGIKKRPGIIGKWTNAYIYEQLPEGVLQALKERTPSKSARYHQSLTPELGHPTLEKQITRVVTLMSVSGDWEEFQVKYNQMVSQTPRSEDFAGKLIYKAKDKPKDLREGYDCLLFDDETID